MTIDDREAIRDIGYRLGFLQVGFAPADPPVHADTLRTWLDAGMHGDMAWMAREDSVRRRADPTEALPGCRTLVMVSMSYAPRGTSAAGPPDGSDGQGSGSLASPSGRTRLPEYSAGEAIVARYARGRDYHRVFEERLARLAEELSTRFPEAETRSYVDYGPVLERDHAQRAGLGWIGKNTMLIHPALGSWTLLGELLTTASIPPDAPFEADRCGTCTRCIEACPTNAITPRAVDARLCISYLTIELRGSIPERLRPLMGRRVFGCDICQEVCPWNDGAPPGDDGTFRLEGEPSPDSLIGWAEQLLDLSVPEFRSRFAETPLVRPGRDGMLRNVCVGLGNSGDDRAVPALMRCLDEPSAIVREHAAWALGRLAEVDRGTAAG